MHLLLCSATELEIAPLLRSAGQGPQTISFLVTGVGLTAATYTITRAVMNKRPDFIIQAGIAGCLDPGIPLTSIVLVENETIGDLGVEENGNFRHVTDMGLLDKDQHPWSGGKLSNNVESLKQAGLKIVDGVTVNEVTTNRNRIEFYRRNFNASIETMEGAALHYVALQEKIPFLQIRSLSNFAGERDKSRWVMGQAISRLNLELERILSKYLK